MRGRGLTNLLVETFVEASEQTFDNIRILILGTVLAFTYFFIINLWT